MRRVGPMLWSFLVMRTRLAWGQKPRTSDGAVIVSFSMFPLDPFTFVLLWFSAVVDCGRRSGRGPPVG